MKFNLIALVAMQAVVAVAAPNLIQPVYRRDNGSDTAKQLAAGVAKVAACFDIALDKAGIKKDGAKVPKPPMGVDCDAIIALVNKASGTGSMPTTTSDSAMTSGTGTMPSTTDVSANPTGSSPTGSDSTATESGMSSATGSSMSSATTSDASSSASGGSMSTSSVTSSKASATSST